MGILDKVKDIKNIDSYKQRINELEKELTSIKEIMTPEIEGVLDLQKKRDKLNDSLAELKKVIENHYGTIEKLGVQISKLNDEINEKNKLIIQLDEQILLQDFGLYEPTYEFANSSEYKEELQDIRQSQKDMIKDGEATTGNTDWHVNGSLSEGRKMVKDMQKLLLRAFNSECDEVIGKVKYNNFESSVKRIKKSCDAISKLGVIMGVSITDEYYDSKIDELTLAFEYRQKIQEEKEMQKEIRAQMREEAKLQKEIENERRKIEKEQTHYENALLQIKRQLETATVDNRAELENKLHEIENHLTDIDKAMKDIDYREANQRAGYVYVISNIGSFGENVYKIGMTRRLDPMERIDELGSASVPFNFDVHAMIFSDDAPKLEAALHRAFENKKLNMVNQRREFFNVTLDEIKDVINRNFDKTVEFIDTADAEQYRISQKIRFQSNNE